MGFFSKLREWLSAPAPDGRRETNDRVVQAPKPPKLLRRDPAPYRDSSGRPISSPYGGGTSASRPGQRGNGLVASSPQIQATNPFSANQPMVTARDEVTPDANPDRRTEDQNVVGLTDSTRQLLEVRGWKLPPIDLDANRPDLSMLDMTQSEDLADYKYTASTDQVLRAEHAFQNAPGFRAPERLPRGDEGQTISYSGGRFAPMTVEAYEALTPDQQNAVKFNTMLATAREEDLAAKPTRGERRVFEEDYERIFGAEANGQRFAPSTLKLIEDLGIEVQDRNLDEFLSMERGFNMSELQDLQLDKGSVIELDRGPTALAKGYGSNNFAEAYSPENMVRVDTRIIEQAGKYLQEALANPEAWDFDSALSLSLTGSLPEGKEIPFGYGTLTSRGTEEEREKDTFFRKAYAHLQHPDTADMSELMVRLNDPDDPWTPEQKQEFFDYLDIRSQWEILNDIGPGEEGGRSAQQIRELIGWD